MSNTPITDMAISACPDMESLYYTQTLQHCSHRLELDLATAKRKIAAQELALEDMEKWMDATQTDSYVQRVPDKCDRIIWRNRYIQLSE